MEIISVGMFNTLWSYWNKKNLKRYKDKTVLLVNEKEDRIVAKLKFLDPPKEFIRRKVYRLYEK